jgi:hypothetical protein
MLEPRALRGRLSTSLQVLLVTRLARIAGLLRVRENALLAAALCSVLAVGGWLRLSGVDWDQGGHLHPDERYLSTVASGISWPSSPLEYLDVRTSPLSPYNSKQGKNLVYGTLPLFATKAVAGAVNDDYYGRYYLVARRLSALVDLATVVLTFFLARLVLGSMGRRVAMWGGVLAAALYALTVTAIQFSHFGTVESWLVFFAALTTYLAARALGKPVGRASRLELSWAVVGVALGLTLACKVSGAFVGAAVAVALLGRTALVGRLVGGAAAAVRLASSGLTVVASGYLAYRLVSPYTFANSFWLDFSINPSYRAALTQQQDALKGTFLSPPAYQWLLSRPIWSPLENLIVWQLGAPLGVVAAAGVVLIAVCVVRPVLRTIRRRAWDGLGDATAIRQLTLRVMLLAFLAAGFFPFATLFAHTGRYLVPLAPILAVTAASAVVFLLRGHRRVLTAVVALLVSSTAAYAFAFHTVYEHTNTRVAASQWIVRHVPPGKTIANEHWDDSLPVGGAALSYRGEIVQVFDPDDEDKLYKLYDVLDRTDYYFLSSPRAWRTIGRLPDRFPLMVRFYRGLFAGKLGFRQVASFRSVPRLLGVKLDDLSAEEAFWVYDHPPVRIFQHARRLSFTEFLHVLCAAPQPTACA